MKPVVYIESSVISYLVSRPSRDIIIAGRQALTLEWWENEKQRFDLRVSALVEDEIGRGDPSAAERRLALIERIPSLAATDNALLLSERLIAEKAIPAGSEDDALYIAIAATQGVDYLLTWNFKHINNAETKKLITRIVESLGYVCPLLCSPEELGGTSNG
ncbi:type II toxin-antitoxin system VapC family toxin [Thiorhodococcus mannitoliphagus]|uniref:Type II toxin-antitoxin system VapC family toxin n=2 Tax=Thiorhodococcus mannitoliphagus TaxID=329406 RepID=A0A6P1E487_9GAMM|nr:type II toxin-antitoxin system VapC family toxin [Thiorhodococcus mannitoliphagus]NEX23766.1 type II toxin-antitoxin system VapC family toxin [Thiorhodococcus mannitoliphagus]